MTCQGIAIFPRDMSGVVRVCDSLLGMSANPVTMADLGWTFGDRLRKIRRVVGVSQAEFADRLSQGRQSLAAWESGLNEPRNAVAVAKRIELAYGVPATWTLGLDGGPGPDGRPRQDSNLQPTGYRPDNKPATITPIRPLLAYAS